MITLWSVHALFQSARVSQQLADLYNLYYNTSNNGTFDNSTEDWSSRIGYHREKASNFTAAVLDLNWDAERS